MVVWFRLSILIVVLISNIFSAKTIFAEVFTIQSSKVTLRMGHNPLGRFDTEGVDALSGKFLLNASGEISVLEPIQFEAAKLTSQVPLRDEHMKQRNLEISKFPFIELTNLKTKRDQTKFEGTLKVKNVSGNISGTFSHKEETTNKEFPQATLYKATITFPATLTQFKIEPPQYMGVGVKDEFEVLIEMFLEEEVEPAKSVEAPGTPAPNPTTSKLRKKGKR